MEDWRAIWQAVPSRVDGASDASNIPAHIGGRVRLGQIWRARPASTPAHLHAGRVGVHGVRG